MIETLLTIVTLLTIELTIETLLTIELTIETLRPACGEKVAEGRMRGRTFSKPLLI